MTKKKPLFRVTNTTYRKNCQRSSRGTEIDNLLRLSSWIRSPPSTATPPPQLNLTFCPAPLSKRAFIVLSPETGQIDKEQQRITSCCLFLPLHQFNRAVLFNKTISIFRILLQVHNIFYLLFSLSHTFTWTNIHSARLFTQKYHLYYFSVTIHLSIHPLSPPSPPVRPSPIFYCCCCLYSIPGGLPEVLNQCSGTIPSPDGSLGWLIHYHTDYLRAATTSPPLFHHPASPVQVVLVVDSKSQ